MSCDHVWFTAGRTGTVIHRCALDLKHEDHHRCRVCTNTDRQPRYHPVNGREILP